MLSVNKIKIGKRLWIVFSIIIVLYSSSLFYNILNINRLSKDVSNIYQIHLVSIDYLIEADRDAFQASVAISQLLTNTVQNNTQMQKENMVAVDENTMQVIERYNKFSEIFNTQTQSENIRLDSMFRSNFDNLHLMTDSILNYIQKQDYSKAESLYYHQYITYFNPMRDAMDKFTEIHLTDSEKAYHDSIYLGERIKQISEILFLVVVLIVIFSALVLTKSIKKPLQQAVIISNNIAQGNLTQNIRVEGNDETSSVLNALQNMSEKLRSLVGEIKTSSSNVLVSSSQITSAAQQLSQSANEQAASTEQITSSVEQMVANINQTSENAQQTEKLATASVQSIQIANASVEKTVEAIKIISEKISIINDIAEKTDLLAVNAAIEAARAGEKGRGFAIVAGEVRELAIQSQKAAANINELSSKSVTVAIESGMLLAKVIPDIQKTASLIQEITASSLEQGSGVTQINTAVQQLSGTTQQNSSASEQLASNAEELSSQSAQLNRSIEFFKTTENELEAFGDLELEAEVKRLNEILLNRKQKRENKNQIEQIVNKTDTPIIIPKKHIQSEPKLKGVRIDLGAGNDNEYEVFK